MSDLATPSRFDWRAFLILCGVFLAVALLWETPWVYPLKILVVFLHEISHGLAAVLSGGSIVEIQLQSGEGGHTYTTGGNAFLIYSAGYLGSMLWGALLLVLVARAKDARGLAVAFGCALVVIAVLYVPITNLFGKVFGIVCGAAVMALAAAPRVWAAMVLHVVAVTSCLYAVLDIKSDVLDRPGLDSDAVRLAGITGVPAVVWGVGWIGVSLAVTAVAARSAVRGRAPEPLADPPRFRDP
jgi:hypothetical protein